MRRSIVAGILVSVAIAVPAQAEMLPGTGFVLGNWRGGAYEINKRFTHCAMSAGYVSGITMFFSVSDNWTWRVQWHHRSWRLTPGQSVPITYQIDSYPPRSLTAHAIEGQLARAELPREADVFEQFRRGYMLTVVAEGQRYQFKLDGTYAALTQLGNCVKAHREIASLNPPPSPAPESPRTTDNPPAVRKAWPRATADQRLEATKVVANIMARSDLGDFRILPDSEVKALDNEFLNSADVVWQTTGLLGLLRIVPKGLVDGADDIASEILAGDSKSCKGTFASGFVTDDVDGAAKRMFTACETSLAGIMLRYTIVPAADGSHYVFITTGRRGEQANREVIDKGEASLRKAVHEVMRR